MKLIYYSPHPDLNLQSLSGYGTHMREMITAFRELGCEVFPIIMGGATAPNETAGSPGLPLKNGLKRVVGARVWETLKDVNLVRTDRSYESSLRENIKTIEPDFIYERASYIQLSGVRSARKSSVPHLLEVNTPQLEERLRFTGTRSFLHKKNRERDREQLCSTDLILPVNTALKEYFMDRYSLDSSRFLVLPNAFNRDSIRRDDAYRERIRQRYNLGGRRVIGFVGSIFEWHNLESLIEAFEMLEQRDTTLLIVGFGEHVENLKQKASESPRSGDILFTGKVEKQHIFDYISVMDICTAPGAAWYQTPIKLFEYGAMAKPVLAPKTAPVRDVITDGEEGFLTDGTAFEIAAQLGWMLNHPGEAKEAGRRLQHRVFHDFTWQTNAKKVLESVRSL